MTPPRSRFAFGLVRLFLFVAFVAATFGVARIVHPRSFIPTIVAGIAISLLVFVTKRRDIPWIAFTILFCMVGAVILAFLSRSDSGLLLGAILGWLFAGVARRTAHHRG